MTTAREPTGPQAAGPAGCGGDEGYISRRSFMQLLGAGLLISVTADRARAQSRYSRRRRGGAAGPVAARLHVGADGRITVLTGKVEVGQGARAQITQAAAEELLVRPDRIDLIMADTDLVPDDGITAGSRTTPSTVPAVRRAAATARKLLVELACGQWNVPAGGVKVADGTVLGPGGRRLTYADLARTGKVERAFRRSVPSDVAVRAVRQWKVLGTSVARPNGRDIVTGAHRFPSDIVREGMLHGKVLRPPSYGAKLQAVDLAPAQAMDGVVVVRDGDFVGCAAPTTHQAEQALAALAATAKWQPAPHPPSSRLFEHLKAHAASGGSTRRGAGGSRGPVDQALRDAPKTLSAAYRVNYVQHAPLETRAAVAEWSAGRLTVWTGSQAPTRVRSELARAFGLPTAAVRVIVPDTGGGFGGKHSGEAAVEAARLARAARRPVRLHWTRREEFTWAYFRPAALIETRAGLDTEGRLVAWDFTSINPGSAGVGCPYDIPNVRVRALRSDGPLREGSYRCLGATANNFARESFIDELAAAAGADPLEFRLRHLREPRLRAVLQAAAERFGWKRRRARRTDGVGVGIACGTEKASFVAACAEVAVDRATGRVTVREVCEAFECGAVQNPANLLAQVHGCIIMGLGPVLREWVRFRDGRILTDTFANYRVPRFADVPKLDVVQLDRTDLPSVGAGETPIIVVAPAVAAAVHHAAGVRIRTMPLRATPWKPA